MPRPLASVLSVLFVAGIAAVLSIPLLNASGELVLRPERFEGLVGTVSHSQQHLATLDEGESEGEAWALRVSERSEMSCLSFDTASSERGGLMCTEQFGEGIGPSQFIPASAGSRRSVLITVLPGNLDELRLRASGGLSIHGTLYALPSLFRDSATVLLVFLPPATDIVAASATTSAGDQVDVSRLADQVDAY